MFQRPQSMNAAVNSFARSRFALHRAFVIDGTIARNIFGRSGMPLAVCLRLSQGKDNLILDQAVEADSAAVRCAYGRAAQ